MDAPRKAADGVSSLCTRRHGGRRAAPERRQPDRRERDLELSQHGRSGPFHARPQESRCASGQAAGRRTETCGTETCRAETRCRSETRRHGPRGEEASAARAAAKDGQAQSEDEEARARPEKKIAQTAESSSARAVCESFARQARLRNVLPARGLGAAQSVSASSAVLVPYASADQSRPGAVLG